MGPYDDGSDWDVKWDYIAKGVVTAHVDVIDPSSGETVEADYTMQVKKVTLVQGIWHYFLDVRYRGAKYTMYVGRNSLGYFVFLPFLGQLIGSGDGAYGPVYASVGDDFSFEFDDPDVDLGY
jgi:hypothetical protein